MKKPSVRRITSNITVAVDRETYHRARVWAALHQTSVSALVTRFLTNLRPASPARPIPPKS